MLMSIGIMGVLELFFCTSLNVSNEQRSRFFGFLWNYLFIKTSKFSILKYSLVSCHCFKPIKWNVCQQKKKNSHKNVIEIWNKHLHSLYGTLTEAQFPCNAGRISYIFLILYVQCTSIRWWNCIHIQYTYTCAMCVCVIHKTTKEWTHSAKIRAEWKHSAKCIKVNNPPKVNAN